jgi:stringent starvation protein B
MTPPQPLPPKKEVALALLERSSVYVHLDPRQGSVVVPPWFKKQPQLVLQVGLNMPVPIRDLRLDDDGMSCTLSFNRSPFFCVVPWSSVFAMVGCEDGRGMVWPDDVPAEVARQAQNRVADGDRSEGPKSTPPGPPPSEMPKAKRPRKRAALGAVPEGNASAVPAPKAARSTSGSATSRPAAAPAQAMRPAAGSPRKKRELPPYLRVVK